MAGPERFRTITSAYYRGAHACLVMYSVADRQSFDRARFYVDEIKQHNQTNCEIAIIGCMSDLTVDAETKIGSFGEMRRRVVLYEEGAALAESFGLPFYECTSAVPDDESVEMITMQIVVNCLRKAMLMPLPPPPVPTARDADADAFKCSVM